MNDNKNLNRFERMVGHEVVFANYRVDGEILYINYVEAPLALRGTGEAGKLMADVMNFAKKNNYKVFPICGYAAAWLRRHPEFQAIMAA